MNTQIYQTCIICCETKDSQEFRKYPRNGSPYLLKTCNQCVAKLRHDSQIKKCLCCNKLLDGSHFDGRHRACKSCINEETIANTRHCSQCNIRKDLSQYNKSHKFTCDTCHKQNTKRYRETEHGYRLIKINRLANKERSSRHQKLKKLENPAHVLFLQIKSRCKKRNIPFNIEESDIVIPEKCPVLGIDIFFGAKHFCYNSPSVDRIDNDKGYIKGNIMVISYRANTLKNNGTLEEHRLIVKYMEKYLTDESQNNTLQL